jgi:rhamnosyltransferase subunit B
MTVAPRLVFEGTGSRGDVAPVLALASRLARRGHRCHVLGNAGYEGEAARAGVELTATVDRAVAFRRGERVDFGEYLFPGLPRVERCLAGATAENTVLINSTRLSASNLFAEQRGIRTLRLTLAPFSFRSLVAPPWPYRAKTEGPLGELYRQNLLPRLYQAMDTNARLLAFVNERRRALGLGPVASAVHPEPHVLRQLALFPAWFCEPARDWPRDTELVGFPLPACEGALPRELADFVARRGAPIVFTMGTFIEHTDAFVALAREACARLGSPGIFLSRHRAYAQHADAPGFLELPFVELAQLLPQAALIVHHGGIGTAARALEAGVPQLVCPIGFDQFDNAQRLRLLGVAQVADRAQLTLGALCAHAAALLGDPALRARASALAAEVEDGLTRAASAVEAVVTGEHLARAS